MLKVIGSQPEDRSGPGLGSVLLHQEITFTSLFKLILRQKWVIAVVALMTMLVAVGYILITPPLYTATASLLIDPRRVQLFRQESVISDIAFDTASVESQLETLRSERIAMAVVRNLKLTSDPEFVGAGPNPIVAAVSAFLGLLDAGESSEEQKTRTAVEAAKRRLDIKRAGLSYVINISFDSNDARKAADIANEFAEAYIIDQLESKYEVTQRASAWLQDRIKELRQQASSAERSALEFKVDNSIVVDATGRLMNDQQMAELSTQLTLARAQSAEAKARYDRISEVNKSNIPDAGVADSLRNEVIVRMRQQYLDAAKRESEWSARYGANHVASVNLRGEMRELQRSIQDELRRIEETYKSDYEISKAREESIQQSLVNLFQISSGTRQQLVTLRELEATAQTYRSLYDNFLQRYMLAVQQQSFPISDGRVITAATPPSRKSWPKTTVILAAGAFAGLGIGFGVALARELLDRVLRTSRQVEELTGHECLGILPMMKEFGTRSRSAMASTTKSADGKTRILQAGHRSMFYVVEQPFSQYAETIRSMKVAADISRLARDMKLIGMVSALPSEGKTTVSSNLARLMAQTGAKTLLIDADMRNPDLTRSLAPDATAGLVEVISGKSSLQDAICLDSLTGMHFLPTVLTVKLKNTNELLASDAMKALLQSVRGTYDYVIVDLPPLVPVVDVRAASHLFDGFFMVIEWGKTSIDVVQQVVTQNSQVADKLVGSILNKANVSVLKQFEHYHGTYYSSEKVPTA
jgi:succinoglycan biosynthesis transport protein ExoP